MSTSLGRQTFLERQNVLAFASTIARVTSISRAPRFFERKELARRRRWSADRPTVPAGCLLNGWVIGAAILHPSAAIFGRQINVLGEKIRDLS